MQSSKPKQNKNDENDVQNNKGYGDKQLEMNNERTAYLLIWLLYLLVLYSLNHGL